MSIVFKLTFIYNLNYEIDCYIFLTEIATLCHYLILILVPYPPPPPKKIKLFTTIVLLVIVCRR